MGKLIEQEGQFYKECQVVTLKHWDKESSIAITGNGVLYKPNNGEHNCYIHLYILSDDEIKDGDWYYQNNPYGSVIDRCDDKSPFVAKSSRYIWENGGKKIIATTDTFLGTLEECPVRGAGSSVKYILPQPSDKFIQAYIEAYNKGEKIEKVLVEVEYLRTPNPKFDRSKGVNKNNPTYLLDETNLVPKTTNNNNIIIKKVKDSWSRDEIRMNVIYALSLFAAEKGLASTSSEMKEVNDWANKWINENL